MGSGMRILNIDQTPINGCQYIQKGWVFRKEGDYVSQHIIWPRITMVFGVDTFGNAYYSLIQANSNDDTIKMYFVELAKILDEERPGWRGDTVF